MLRFKISKKRFFYFLGGMLIFLSAMHVAIGMYLPRIVAQVKNPVATWFNPQAGQSIPPDFKKYNIRKAQTFRFKTFDGLYLSAYYVPAKGNPKGTVIALHGYRSNKNKYLPVIHYFTENGYDFVAMDMRAHNESEGEIATFSYLERKDVRELIDFLKIRHFLQAPVILYGHSAGASTALFTASAMKDVRAVIAESPFAGFEEIFPRYVKYYTGIGWDYGAREGGKWIFDHLNIPPDSLNLLHVTSRISVPVLIIHGTNDPKIPPSHAVKIYKSLGSSHKELLQIPGGTHTNLWEKDRDQYFKNILRFLDINLQ